jgi:murein DD-endopeptidase MepM/ murein hydrolase activator NlpD
MEGMKNILCVAAVAVLMGAGCLSSRRAGPLPAEPVFPAEIFKRPLKGPITILSRFGPRGKGHHTGIDLRVNRGKHDPVYASRDGRVVFLGRLSGYGKLISLQHSDGFYTRYAHLHYTDVKKGERVAQGQKIGAVGRTGRASTEHLHFEILTPKSRFLDPYSYLFGTVKKTSAAK